MIRIAGRGLERALVVLWRRFVAENENDFAFGVDSRVVVVAILFGCNTIARENNVTFHVARTGKAQGGPIFVQYQGRLFSQCYNCRLLYRHSGGDIKFLQVAPVVTSRTQTNLGEFSSDIVPGKFDAWGVDTASSKLFRRQIPYVISKRVGTGLRQ